MLCARRRRSTGAVTMAALTGAAAALAMVAGCGTAPAGEPGAAPHPASRAPSSRTAHAGPVAGSAKQAQRLAAGLLSHLRLPAGSHRVPWHPPSGLGQTEIPMAAHQADVRELWRVPAPMTVLAGYIRAHRPAGLPFQGFGQASSGGQVFSETTTFALRPVPAGVQSAQLTLEITPAGHDRSMLRADGEVTWYPPRPAGEYLVASRFHEVTVAAGLLNPAPHIVRRSFTSRSVIARLARFLNSLPATPGGLMGCPMVSATYAVTFRHAAGGRPYLTASASACGTVGIVVNGLAQPGLADPNAVITRAVQAALAGHPGSLAPAPGPTGPAPVPVISPATVTSP